jgi:hypothetical protein
MKTNFFGKTLLVEPVSASALLALSLLWGLDMLIRSQHSFLLGCRVGYVPHQQDRIQQRSQEAGGDLLKFAYCGAHHLYAWRRPGITWFLGAWRSLDSLPANGQTV